MGLVDVLNENAGLIRTQPAGVLQIRHTPSLQFRADLSRESEEAIEKILAEADPLPDEKAEEVIEQTRRHP